MNKEKGLVERDLTEEQRLEFIEVARDQGHKVSDNVKLKPIGEEELERIINEE